MKLSLFAYGFRPHFFLAGVAALLLVPVWAVSFAQGTMLGTSWPPTLWHAHEMLFGFIGSAIAGFMLTAVPSWTGQKGFSGLPLVVLTALWLGARLLIASAGSWPAIVPAAVDLAFLPLVAALVCVPLLRSKNRNTPLLLVLLALWLTNVVFHVALVRHDAPLARHALIVGIDVVIFLIAVIGGRIVPAFTASALRGTGADAGITSHAGLGAASLCAMAVVVAGDVLWLERPITGLLAAVAAVLLAARLLQWKTLRTLRRPIVWILHLAYAWLPLGLALKALALLGGYALGAFWLHALTVGAAATMILGVMTRAALGHTGRPLVMHPLVTVAYALLTAAALVRVFGFGASGLAYPAVILCAAALWTLAFAIFLGVYAPILWLPRVDGKPG